MPKLILTLILLLFVQNVPQTTAQAATTLGPLGIRSSTGFGGGPKEFQSPNLKKNHNSKWSVYNWKAKPVEGYCRAFAKLGANTWDSWCKSQEYPLDPLVHVWRVRVWGLSWHSGVVPPERQELQTNVMAVMVWLLRFFRCWSLVLFSS